MSGADGERMSKDNYGSTIPQATTATKKMGKSRFYQFYDIIVVVYFESLHIYCRLSKAALLRIPSHTFVKANWCVSAISLYRESTDSRIII